MNGSGCAEKIHIDLSGAPETMLAMLYAKALDADAETPVLGDARARELVSRLDYDWSKTFITKRNAFGFAARTAHFDNWARHFLAAHESATVLHLGCGLDGRVFRLNPGPGVEWYDVDYPDVIALYERLYPRREHHHLVPACVTDPEWLQAIPSDRPTLLLAEGLTPYLTDDAGVALLRRVVERFPCGELQFDVFNSFAVRAQKINPVVRRSGATWHWAINGPRDIIERVPGLRPLAAMPVYDANSYRDVSAIQRFAASVLKLIPAIRNVSQYHRYAF